MIHKRLAEQYEEATTALNDLFNKFPYIEQKGEGHDDRQKIRMCLSSAWGGIVRFYEEMRMRDERLDNSHAVLNDLIENVPEARVYYQKMLDEGNRYKVVLQNTKDKEPLIRY